MKTMEILRYKAINKGAVKGIFSLKVPKWGLIVNDMTFFEKDGRRWVSFPSKPYESEGVKKYFPLLQFEQKAHLGKLTDALLPLLAEAEKSAQNANKEELGPSEQGELPF